MQINENNINVTTFPDVIKASMKVTQNDKDTNEIIIKVFDPSGTEIIYSGITSAKIVFTKPDYNVVQGDMTVRTSDLYYKMGTNEIACAGMVTAKIQLLGASNERLTVGGFKFDVLQDPVTPWSVQSTSEYGILEQILYDANSHINNTSNPHSVSKAQVGLGDADNTSDLSKPISEATQVALDNKEPTITKNTAFNADFDTTVTNVKMDGVRSLGLLGTVARADHVHPTDTSRLAVDANAVSASKLQTERTFTISGDASGNVNFDGSANVDIAVTVADDSHNHVISNIDGLQVALDAKTSLESPALTGTPTAPTAATSTSTTQIATTAFVQSALGAGGYGDMMTASYDSNADGKVNSADNADTVGGFTVGVNVPANAVFTDTVTAVNNTLTSTSTTEALSAAQGKALKDAATSHLAEYTSLISKLPVAPNSNILTVAKTGGMFTTINAAITKAREYCTTSNRVTIYVGSGSYDEAITLLPNPGIDIIGSGSSNTIIITDTAYPNCPLHTVGEGTFKDIHFYSTAPAGSYGFHFESQADPAEGSVYFYNCKFSSLYHSGVGVGMGNNTAVYFINCIIETYAASEGAFYAHNYPSAGALSQFLYVYNCYITNQAGGNPVRIENAYTIAGGNDSNNQMFISFAGTTARLPKVSYKRGATDILKFVPSSSDNIVLLDNSEGTNILGLDYYKNRPRIGGYFYCASNGVSTIPYPESYRYTWTIEEVRDVNGVDISSTCTIGVSDKNYIQIMTTTEGVKNNVVNATVRGIPKY